MDIADLPSHCAFCGAAALEDRPVTVWIRVSPEGRIDQDAYCLACLSELVGMTGRTNAEWRETTIAELVRLRDEPDIFSDPPPS